MLESSEKIKQHFVKNFTVIYQNPEKINYYLKKNSEVIEKDIRKSFLDLGLESNFCIYANGGFGRKEIFPSSDIDISIVEKSRIQNFKNLEIFISGLWDKGFVVGHSVRSIKDLRKIAKADVKEYTSYLTRRPLVSEKKIDDEISKTLSSLWSKEKFYKAKKNEQIIRHREYHSTSFNLEPNLKESPGTLRDFQTALWILQHCYNFSNIKSIKDSPIFKDEFKLASKSYDFIKTLRFALNIINKGNRLNFESQLDISKLAKLKLNNSNKAVEEMMKSFYEMASSLSYFNNLVFETFEEENLKIKPQNKDIYFLKNKIGLHKKQKLNKSLVFKLFLEMGSNKSINGLDTKTMAFLKKNINLIDTNFRNNKKYANQFLEILRSKHNLSSILNILKNTGILQKYIPEFEDVIGQMQFDLFHVYTVDEHTFKVVKSMREMKTIEQQEYKLENELINKLSKIEILYIAGLFHDLGKGKKGDHSEIGAKTSYKFAKRLGMSDTDASLISWLVKKHLIMSSVSQKRDISDAKTIEDFANEVKINERLDYLYLLTINDIKSTNPKLWNGWKHQLLRDLYILTRSKLNKEPEKAFSEIASERKNKILNLSNKYKNKDAILQHLDSFDEYYFTKNSTEVLTWQIELLAKSKEDEFIVGCRRKFDELIEIFIKVNNSDGLFHKLAKVLEHSGLNVIDANIFSSNDNLVAANTFITKYSPHDRQLNKSELIELSERIKKNFKNFKNISKLPEAKNQKNHSFKKIVEISHSINHEKQRNMITIETSDSVGLLAKIAKVFHENEISIFCARINTLGERVEDTFEIVNMQNKIISNTKIKKLIKELKLVV